MKGLNDIRDLSVEELDALIDDLDEVLQVMYMYDVHVIDNDVVKMIQLAHECTEGINALCKELRNFKKPAQFKPMITAVHEAETKADKVFIQAMHDEFVFAKQTNVEFIDAYGQAKLLEALEEICDVCEDVTGTIAMIVMKNS